MNLDNYIRKHIKNIPFYEGVDPSIKLAEESGILPEDIIKLNANENPFGKTLALGENLSSINIHEYPDPNQKLLRKSLSKYTGKKIDQLVAGSGSDELIDILIRIFLAISSVFLRSSSFPDAQTHLNGPKPLSKQIGPNISWTYDG